MTDLRTPLRKVLGKGTADALEKGRGLCTVEDLLRHYPRRYLQRGELTDLSLLRPGEHVTIQARVTKVEGRTLPRRPGQRRDRHLFKVEVSDGTHDLRLSIFNQPWQGRRLEVGRELLFAGKVEQFKGRLQLTNPVVDESDDADAFAGGLVPIYPATATMQTWKIAKAVRTVLDVLGDVPDPLPPEVRRFRRLPPLAEAFRLVHLPKDRAEAARAMARFRYEEAFVLQVVLALRRAAARALKAIPRRAVPGGLVDAFDARLPFELTAGQRAVGEQIVADLAQPHPMQRLLQGEVGSGKTVVALRAMLTVVDAGGQFALLAPTEVLGAPHYRSIRALLGPLAESGMLGGDERGTQVVLLTGSQPTAARRAALLAAASGDAGIVVGTHALLQEHVDFHDLGLVVIDEQHRFGVEQRDALRAKGSAPPHVLVMTATPIPRTVAITVFGDLDVSTLDELPAGRGPITTHVVPRGNDAWYARAWQRVREEVDAGRRTYVVCPRIGDGAAEDDTSAADGSPDAGPAAEEGGRRPPLAVLDVVEELRARPELAGVSIDVMHGRLGADAKDDVMRRFAAGQVQVLVATTVIEVGVDVPEASVMVVMDAERFGISQLHQLRGRVGRGGDPGLCLLVTTSDGDGPAMQRLRAVEATTDGFELSRLDLEQRREGDVLGATQSGRRSSLRVLAVVRDEEEIRAARVAATGVVEADPDLARHPALAEAVADLLAADRADYLEKA